jgi:hypothetical protein
VSTGYLCPDIDAVKILNNPMDGGKDTNFMTMELVYCDSAAFYLGYVDPNCETNHTRSQELFKQHTVTTDFKYVSQFFNPSIYYQNR